MKNWHAPIALAAALVALLTTGCAATAEPRLTVLPTPHGTAPGATVAPTAPDAPSGPATPGAAEETIACAGGTASIAGRRLI